VTQTPLYGRTLKRILFEETDHQHAKLIIRLRHNSISQSDFFRAIVNGFINGDERICSFIEDHAAEQKLLNKARLDKSRSLQKIGRQNLQDFALSNEDVEDVYDIIENEMPEL
jgi:hypothetical protein